jgi:hypothetical protein
MSIGRIYTAPILPEPVIRSDTKYSGASPSLAGFITHVLCAACKERPDSFKHKVNSRVSLNELPPANKRWFGKAVPPLSEPVVKPAPVKLTRGFFSPFSGKIHIPNLKFNKAASYSPEKAAAKTMQKKPASKSKTVFQHVGYYDDLARFITKFSKMNKYPSDITLEKILDKIEAGETDLWDNEDASPSPASERRTLPKDIGETSSLSGSDSGCDILSDGEDASRPPVPLEPVVIIKTAKDRKAENLQVKVDNFYNQFDESRTRENDRRRPNPSAYTLKAQISNHHLCQKAKPPVIIQTWTARDLQNRKFEDFVIPFNHSDYLAVENDRNRKLSVRGSDDDFLEELKKEIKECARIFEESQAYHYLRYKKLREKIDGLNGVMETIDEDSILCLPPAEQLNDYYHSLRDEIMLAIAREKKTIIVDNAGRKINPVYVENEPEY